MIFFFFLETNGLENILLFLGIWQFPSPCNVKQQVRAPSLKRVLSKVYGSFSCCVWVGAEPTEHERAQQLNDTGGCRATWVLKAWVISECLLGVTFSKINYGLLFLVLRVCLITQFHLFSVQHYFLHPKAGQNFQTNLMTLYASLCHLDI